jgi:hypothetical protein
MSRPPEKRRIREDGVGARKEIGTMKTAREIVEEFAIA